jgi:hypothetical protein
MIKASYTQAPIVDYLHAFLICFSDGPWKNASVHHSDVDTFEVYHKKIIVDHFANLLPKGHRFLDACLIFLSIEAWPEIRDLKVGIKMVCFCTLTK